MKKIIIPALILAIFMFSCGKDEVPSSPNVAETVEAILTADAESNSTLTAVAGSMTPTPTYTITASPNMTQTIGIVLTALANAYATQTQEAGQTQTAEALLWTATITPTASPTGTNTVSPTCTPTRTRTCIPETCNGFDDDCDGIIDNNLSAPACSKQYGACSGAVQTCEGGMWKDCTDADYLANSPMYESGDETSCDAVDNNCNNLTDEMSGTLRPLCANQTGVCGGARKSCIAGMWNDCMASDYLANNSVYEATTETKCDGLDNNCNAATDEMSAALRPSCAKQAGVCAGSKQTCGGVSGWISCTDSSYLAYNSAYEPVESTCGDILDNDCDTQADCADGSCTGSPSCP